MAERLTMRAAVQLLGLSCDTNRASTCIVCPVCSSNSRKKKLSINFDKNGEGCFRCAKCSESGGPIKFWGLFRGINDPKEAAKDYYSYIDNPDEKKKVQCLKKEPVYKKIDLEVAPISVRDRTYKELLKALPLSSAHLKKLKARGLSEEAIIKNGYKSYPLTRLNDIAKQLLQEGCVLEGVPGFFKYAGRWTLISNNSGILIPQRDGFGRIEGFQIRFDDPAKPADDFARYKSLSTRDMQSGAPAFAYCHLRKGDKGLDEVILTEGPLKADVITELSSYSVLAVPGVNSLKYLPRALVDMKANGLKKIVIAYDMDIRENVHVQKAESKLEEMLCDFRIPYSILEWNAKEKCKLKGLDDWLDDWFKHH